MSIVADLYHKELHADPDFDPSPRHRALLADGVEVVNWAHSSVPELAVVAVYQARTGAAAAAVAAFLAAAPGTAPTRRLGQVERDRDQFESTSSESESEDSPAVAATMQAGGGIFTNRWTNRKPSI
jgi:hypothetical protein